jgi:hypothetical protein
LFLDQARLRFLDLQDFYLDADAEDGLIRCIHRTNPPNVFCERRGTHILALKHAAPRLRGLRLGLQTRAGHGPDGAHANQCAYPAVEKICRASSAGPPKNFRTLYGLKWVTSVEKRHRLPISEALRCPRKQIKFSLERFQIPSRICLRAQPLKNPAGRVPQAADCTCNKIS